MGMPRCETDLLCLTKFVFVIFVGPTLCILSISQLLIEWRTEKPTGVLKRIIHRSTFIGSILFTGGWVTEVFVEEDPYPPTIAFTASLLVDLSSLVMTLLLVTVAYIMIRRLYRAHNVPFPLVRSIVFWGYIIWLTLCCIIATTIAAILDKFWPKTIYYFQLFIGSIGGTCLLWYRFYTFDQYMKLAASGFVPSLENLKILRPLGEQLLPSASESEIYPKYVPSEHFKRFRTYLILKTLFIFCGVGSTVFLSFLFPDQPQAGFQEWLTDESNYPTDLVWVMLQVISIVQAMWFGWVYCNQISQQPLYPSSIQSSSRRLTQRSSHG